MRVSGIDVEIELREIGACSYDVVQENNSVTALREKIKAFLAAQGMIKGHSGSGPRSSEADPQVLILVDHLHTSPSSPATPTLSAPSSSEPPQPPHNPPMGTSFERSPHYPAMPPPEQQQQQPHQQPPQQPPQQYTHSTYPRLRPCRSWSRVLSSSSAAWQPAIPEMGPDPNAMNRTPMLHSVHDMMFNPAAPPPPALQVQPQQPQPEGAAPMIQSPPSIVSASSTCKAPYRY
ncbi:hypothetical protein C8Q70DRAFT_408407 [Cubamyces menziesii]|nr:hypothetical protein C8Q70DRAFT_408407 [Cubamyces menziesii]